MKPDAQPRPPLSREEFARVRELFAGACDLPPEARRAFVDARSAENDAVRAAVEELLDSHDQAERSTGANPLSEHTFGFSTEPAPPTRIGHYRIQSVIGRGGMGVVYLAEQSNPQREVALKVVRRGMESSDARSRFAREIRVLGRLEHPGITRIYEAGTADDPAGPIAYFAMEYVRGSRLTDAAQTLGLDVPARVELAARIADAVQHAHAKGVIHRDLKPANILVCTQDVDASSASASTSVTHSATSGSSRSAAVTRTGGTRLSGPQPKILDFGVARLLEPDTLHSAVTEAGLVIGTIGYMSPEQLAGDINAIDARTDVYAIGVILYELLTGRLPYNVKGKPIAEAARIVKEDIPAPLGPVPGIRASLARDLETIIRHATERDRERRYPTAAALADDLRRFLRDEPILARPASAAYQLSKFARRNKGLVVGSGIGAASLVIGLMLALAALARTIEANKVAETKSEASRAVTQFLTSMLSEADPGRAKGESITVRSAVDRAAARLDTENPFAGRPGVEADLRLTLGKTFISLGAHEEAKTQLEKAIALNREAFGEISLEAADAVQNYAMAFSESREYNEAKRIGLENVKLWDQLVSKNDVRRASALNNLATTLADLNELPEAKSLLEQSVSIYRANKVENEQSIRCLNNLASIEADLGNLDEALRLHSEVLPLRRKIQGENHPGLATTLANIGFCHFSKGELDKAIDFTAQSLQIRRRLLPPGHIELAIALNNLGAMKLKNGDTTGALQAFDEALPIFRSVEKNGIGAGGILIKRAKAYRLSKQFDLAERDLLEAHAILVSLVPPTHIQMRACIEGLAALYDDWNRPDEAARWRPAPPREPDR